MSDQQQDIELDAMKAMIAALHPLDEAARRRVLFYVIERLGIVVTAAGSSGSEILLPSLQLSQASGFQTPSLVGIDIRKLKEDKAPNSVIEMAILVAYYVSELAPLDERKSSINASDLDKYFKQAKYPLPRSLKDVLPNTKKAGFLESISQGEYKLNSVGYNLAVHGLPRKNK